MGQLHLEKLFPKETGHPGIAEPINRLGLPKKALLMRCGFETADRAGLFFEGETSAAVRLVERLWEYKQAPDTAGLRRGRQWRLEFAVGIANRGPVRDGHVVVMAQEPYENAWLQRACFRKYSKKAAGKPLPTAPHSEVLEKGHFEHPVEWLERDCEFDPWEREARYVAGFSYPKGFLSTKPRNSGGDFVVGICPDFDHLVARLLKADEIQRLMDDTYRGRIIFWNQRKVRNPPRLHAEVIDECPSLMMISVQQSLAGPRHSPERWKNQHVWKLTRLIYLDHLNARNKSTINRLGKNVILDDNMSSIDDTDLWRMRKRGA